MDVQELDKATSRPRRVIRSKPIPPEGENELFTQSWFPICLSEEVDIGAVKGFDFLDGRVVVFRGQNGKALVTSAYCPHLGASLEVGDVVGNNIRCAFHHWEYDQDGWCVKTGAGDPPPPSACLFKFPTCEKYGVIWAFNGEEALFEIPDFPYPDEELEIRAVRMADVQPVDPWVQCCNTPDLQHLRVVHGITFDGDGPDDSIDWTDHSCVFDVKGTLPTGDRIELRLGVHGTSLFVQSAVLGGRWFGFMVPMGLPRPGQSVNYMVMAARKSDGTPEDVAGFLGFIEDFETKVISEDDPILRSIRFRPGVLTRSDRALAKYFDLLRNYPRAHPSADFIK